MNCLEIGVEVFAHVLCEEVLPQKSKRFRAEKNLISFSGPCEPKGKGFHFQVLNENQILDRVNLGEGQRGGGGPIPHPETKKKTPAHRRAEEAQI